MCFTGPTYEFVIGSGRRYVLELLQKISGDTGENLAAGVHERLG